MKKHLAPRFRRTSPRYKPGILLTYCLPGIHWVVPKAGHFPFQLIDMIGARCRTRTGTAVAGQGILSTRVKISRNVGLGIYRRDFKELTGTRLAVLVC
jgi:hypothetical protein